MYCQVNLKIKCKTQAKSIDLNSIDPVVILVIINFQIKLSLVDACTHRIQKLQFIF